MNISKKWLLACTYNPNKNLISNHLKEIGKNLDNYSSKYNNFIFLGDFNSEPTESTVRYFCEIYSCKSLIKDSICFKNPLKYSCIYRGGGSIFKLKGPRCGFKLSLVSRLGLMGQKILKISYSRTPENGPICQILLCS